MGAQGSTAHVLRSAWSQVGFGLPSHFHGPCGLVKSKVPLPLTRTSTDEKIISILYVKARIETC